GCSPEERSDEFAAYYTLPQKESISLVKYSLRIWSILEKHLAEAPLNCALVLA
ncbi:13619_t:CDS:2, partial [Cetraspora pellucida]